MRPSVVILTLLFSPLLLMAGCSEEQGSDPKETTPASTASARTVPATTASNTGAGATQASVTIVNSADERVPVRVEVADTPAKRQRGLMGRTTLPEDAGMLFIFDLEVTNSFYMKDTLIPLSIAFIDSQGRIVDIQDMQPLDETQHFPGAPYQFALEVNQGFFAKHGIEVGNELQ